MHSCQSLVLVLTLSQCLHLHVAGADSSDARAPDLTKVRVAAGVSHTAMPVRYEWRKDGTDIPNATNAVLTLTNVTPSDAAQYTVAVSNAEGSVISAPVTVTVLLDPRIMTQPSSQTATEGQSVTIGVKVAGTSPFTYQWWKNGLTLPAANQPMLVLTNLTLSDAAAYSVLVGNARGSMISAEAILTIHAISDGQIHTIVIQPDEKIVVGGQLYTTNRMQNHIMRLNSNGSLDRSFEAGGGVAQHIAIALQADGRVIWAESVIARLHPDGRRDPTFEARVSGGFMGVRAIAIQPDGGIVIGGDFTSVNGIPRNYIARLYGGPVIPPLSLVSPRLLLDGRFQFTFTEERVSIASGFGRSSKEPIRASL